MRQPGLAATQNAGDAAMSSKELLLHSIKEEEEARSTARSSLAEARDHASKAEPCPRSSHSRRYSGTDCHTLAEGSQRKSAQSSADSKGVPGEEAGDQVNAVDIGLKVANEIIGLHSQAAAAGRALAHSTRHVELMQEENTHLKEELATAKQAQRAMEEEIGRIKAKLSQRSIEMLMQEQKMQAADEKTAEQEACLAAAHEKYDTLVMRLMVVVVKASVAAEELENTLQAARSAAGINCTCKPAMHHAFDVLSSLAAFRDTLLQGTVPPEDYGFTQGRAPAEACSQRGYGPAGAAAPSPAALAAPPGAQSRGAPNRDAGSIRLERRRSSSTNGGYPRSTGVAASSSPGFSRQQIKRPSSAGDVSRQGGVPSGWAGDSGRSALTRSVDVPSLQLAALQQQLQHRQEQLQQRQEQLQQIQEQRQARTNMTPAGKRAARSSSITSSREVSPRRGLSVGAPGTDTLSAAANLVYGSIMQQKKQLRASVSGRRATMTASTHRVSSSSVSKAAGRRTSSSSTLNHPAWNAGSGHRRRSSAAPSALVTPRNFVGYDQEEPWSGAVNGLSSSSFSNLMGVQYDSQYDSLYGSIDALQLDPRTVHSSKGSFSESVAHQRPPIARRPSSASGWY